MLYAMVTMISLLPAVMAAGAHDAKQLCSCAQHEADHPFTIDCSNVAAIRAATLTLESAACQKPRSDTFEWGGTFATSANAYTWVSQAATNDATVASGKKYKDPDMKLVVFAMDHTDVTSLFAKAATANTLMGGTCPEVNMNSGKQTITPTTAGTCVTLKFPDSSASLVDFHATINTNGIAHVAFFTEHGPTEFERDTHYFMSTDLKTDIEPVQKLGAAAAHDHGRRLAATDWIGNRRGLANKGTCCTSVGTAGATAASQQGAWKQVVAYHDLCDHKAVPTYIEKGFHDYEASCENYFCNLVGPTVDQLTCPFPPPSPPLSPPSPPLPPSSTGVPQGTLVGIIVAAVVVVMLFVIGCAVLVSKEKAGKPMFTQLEKTSQAKAPATTSASAA